MEKTWDSGDYLVSDNSVKGKNKRPVHTKKEKHAIPKYFNGNSGSKFYTDIKEIKGNYYQGDRTEYKNCQFKDVEKPPNCTQERTTRSNEFSGDNTVVTDAMLNRIKKPVSNKYFELGEELHIPAEDLTKIYWKNCDHPFGNQEMLLEMLKLWREKLDKNVTLYTLINALRKIGAEDIVEELLKLSESKKQKENSNQTIRQSTFIISSNNDNREAANLRDHGCVVNDDTMTVRKSNSSQKIPQNENTINKDNNLCGAKKGTNMNTSNGITNRMGIKKYYGRATFGIVLAIVVTWVIKKNLR